jgi:hypothetical protein
MRLGKERQVSTEDPDGSCCRSQAAPMRRSFAAAPCVRSVRSLRPGRTRPASDGPLDRSVRSLASVPPIQPGTIRFAAASPPGQAGTPTRPCRLHGVRTKPPRMNPPSKRGRTQCLKKELYALPMALRRPSDSRRPRQAQERQRGWNRPSDIPRRSALYTDYSTAPAAVSQCENCPQFPPPRCLPRALAVN